MNTTDLKARLDELTEQLNKALIEFEGQLQDLNLGVQASIKIKDTEIVLGYGRIGDSWCMFATYPTPTKDGEPTTQPILRSPRQIRLFAYKHRDEIKEGVIKAAKSLADCIEKALVGEVESNA